MKIYLAVAVKVQRLYRELKNYFAQAVKVQIYYNRRNFAFTVKWYCKLMEFFWKLTVLHKSGG